MPASIDCARAGVTTGEWTETLRAVFGEYRAPTGVARAVGVSDGRPEAARREVEKVSRRLGRRMKILVGKPGLDGHSNGAEQIAVRARDCGMEVVYEGIRLTPGAPRQRRARGERARRGPVDPVGRPRLAGRRRAEGPARGRYRRCPGRGRRHHPTGRRRGADRRWRGARLYAQGLRPTQTMRDVVAVVDNAWKQAAQRPGAQAPFAALG